MDPHENHDGLEPVLEAVLQLQQHDVIDDKQLQDECSTIIKKLVNIKAPKTAQQIKEYQNCLVKITKTMAIFIDRSTDAERIFINCLRTLYEQMLSNGRN